VSDKRSEIELVPLTESQDKLLGRLISTQAQFLTYQAQNHGVY